MALCTTLVHATDDDYPAAVCRENVAAIVEVHKISLYDQLHLDSSCLNNMFSNNFTHL